MPNEINTVVGIVLDASITGNLAVAERTSTGLNVTKAGVTTRVYFDAVSGEPNILAVTYAYPDYLFILLTDKKIPG